MGKDENKVSVDGVSTSTPRPLPWTMKKLSTATASTPARMYSRASPPPAPLLPPPPPPLPPERAFEVAVALVMRNNQAKCETVSGHPTQPVNDALLSVAVGGPHQSGELAPERQPPHVWAHPCATECHKYIEDHPERTTARRYRPAPAASRPQRLCQHVKRHRRQQRSALLGTKWPDFNERNLITRGCSRCTEKKKKKKKKKKKEQYLELSCVERSEAATVALGTRRWKANRLISHLHIVHVDDNCHVVHR